MDAFSTHQLQRLMREQEGPCVSVYLPTHVSGQAGQQDPVRLKNLLQRAEEQLCDGWMRAAEARKLLQEARNLPTDPAFWDDRSHGLAIFISPAVFEPYRMPVAFDELAVVHRRFHIKPLLPVIAADERFFTLTLSQNSVRLFAGSRHALEQVDVPDLPSNMEQALNYAGADRGSQAHSAMRGSLGKQAAVFHGQGGQSDTHKDDLASFFRLVNAALHPVLQQETAPLLLAGVDYLLPIYREANSYPRLAEPALVGNCDYLTSHQIHERAWPLMQPWFERAREETAARYCRLANTERASADLRKIVPAAHEGRIEALFVDVHALQWGAWDPQSGTVELHDQAEKGDEDLLDLAAVQTLLHGGSVYAVEADDSPSGGPAAAVYRF